MSRAIAYVPKATDNTKPGRVLLTGTEPTFVVSCTVCGWREEVASIPEARRVAAGHSQTHQEPAC